MPLPHVVHLTTVHKPFDTRIFHKECRSLAQAGYRVSLVARHTQQETVDGVEVIPLPSYRNRLLRMLFGTWAAYRTARDLHADLYHFHDPELLPVGVLLKRRTHARVVYDVHEAHSRIMLAREWMFKPLRRPASIAVRTVEKWAVPAFDALVCVTEKIAALYPGAKSVVVRNYPPLHATTALGGSEQYNPQNFNLIYTGGWTDHRGVYQIVQALGHVRQPQVRLIVLGPCIDPQVQQRAQDLPGYGKVDYLGVVAFTEVPLHLQRSAIGLALYQPLPAFELTEPNKVFEYMGNGLPVIASNSPKWREIVEGERCGLTVDPASPEQIAQAIDTLLADPVLRQQMGQNGRRAVLTTYNWEKQSEVLIALYKELLGL